MTSVGYPFDLALCLPNPATFLLIKEGVFFFRCHCCKKVKKKQKISVFVSLSLFSVTLTTVSKLRKELSPYLPVFRVEEDHCGLSTTATLTVSVVNSVSLLCLNHH